MAKKKKGGKGGKKKAKSDVTALEKKTFLINIRVLEGKLDRKEKLCQDLREMIDVYRAKYESELKEKKSIVIHLQEAIKKAIDFKELQRRNLVELEKQQQLELENLKNRLLTTESDMISVSEALTNENNFLRRRLDAFERFGSEINITHASISNADKYLPQEVKKFEQRMSEKTEQARALMRCIRLQVVPLIAEKAGIFQLNVAKGIDPAYIKTIKESIRIEDLLRLLSKSVSVVVQENEELKEKLRFMQQEHKMKVGIGRAKTIELQALRKLVCVLREKQLEQAKRVNLVHQLQEKNEAHQSEIGRLECCLSSIKDKMNTFREGLENNEGLIKKTEEQLSFEKQLFQKLESIVGQVQQLIHKEVIASLDSNIEKTEFSLVVEIFELFSASLKDVEDEEVEVLPRRDSNLESSEESEQLVTYTPGDCGILYTLEELPKLSTERESVTKRDAIVQTEEQTTCDTVSAKILSDVGLLNKFETRTLS